MNRQIKKISTSLSLFLTVVLCQDVWAAPSVTASENKEKLLTTRSCRKCDLSNLDFNRADLAGVDLEGADLSFSTFFLANLAGANLKNTRLQGTIFGGADLGEADLRGADVRGARLDSAYLGGAILEGEFVTGQIGEEVDLEKEVFVADQAKPKMKPEKRGVQIADRRDFEQTPPVVVPKTTPPVPGSSGPAENMIASPPKATVLPSPQKNATPDAPVVKKIIPMQPAVVESVAVNSRREPVHVPAVKEHKPEKAFSAVKARGSAEDTIPEITALALDKAKRDNLSKLLDENRCYECDLSGLDLSGQDLKGVDLEKANLSGCNLKGADLKRANLKGAVLKGADLSKADLREVDFYRADLSNADLTEARQKDTMFDNAVLDGTVGVAFSPLLSN